MKIVSYTADEIVKTLHGVGVNSITRLAMMRELTAFLDDETFWKVFNETWSGCDDTWHDIDHLLDDLEIRDDELRHLDSAQAAFLAGFGDSITIYRGCERDRIRGVAWTTDIEVAKGFMRGHRGIRLHDPVLATAKVRRKGIFTVILDRDESELIVNPRSLRYIRTLKMPAPYA